MSLLRYAQITAARTLRNPELEDSLRLWWVKKYQLPWTHDLAQEQTESDLLVEFYEDIYQKNPSEARKALGKDGEFFFENTGDPLFDKWERELAVGLTPDLEEGLSQEQKAQLRKERELAAKPLPVPFQDDYTGTNTIGSSNPTPPVKDEWIDLLGK